MSTTRVTLKRYSYSAYPTTDQEQHLARTFGCVRVVYNKYIETAKSTKKHVGYNQACKNLVILKKELEWLTEVSSSALQQVLKDVTKGVSNHFKNPKHFGLPKFKSRSNRQSYRVVGSGSFRVIKLNEKWSEVVLPKMLPLRFRTERALPSVPKSVTVIRNLSGKYEVSFTVEVSPEVLPQTNKRIALDLGLSDYATTIDTAGAITKVPNPRYYRKAETKLAKLQQEHARKQKGSNNRDKARVKIAKQHEKIVNQRKDFVKKLVKVMVCENQTIITETLAITNMNKNRTLSKTIMDASWGMFLTSLDAKCAETGRDHVKVDRFFPSSKTCSNCGSLKDTLTLSERTWTCEHCKTVHDRDVNAAMNLLVVGLSGLSAGRAESLNASFTGGTILPVLTL